MEISNLTFIVTDDCNFNCSYCFQKKEKKTINNAAYSSGSLGKISCCKCELTKIQGNARRDFDYKRRLY